MNDDEALVSIIAILMPLLIVVAVVFRPRRDRTPPGAEADQLTALMATAQRMERRIESLEMLLDTEVPGWRSRSTHG